VDEFDWDWIWHQRLLVKPGTYQVMVTHEGNTIWSGSVNAKAGQRVTVFLDRNGQMKTQAWKTGLTMGPQPRFHAGIASATVAPAPVTAQLNAERHDLGCGESTSLNWNSLNAVDTSTSGLGTVAAQGHRTVTPTHNMTYTLTAKGPGGESTQTVTVDVNTQPTATLALSQPEVRYHKVGDKVVEQDSATLNWSATNANSASVEPFGSVATSGSRTVTADPMQTHTGPVNEDITYTFTTSNACGGTTTKTATLHAVGKDQQLSQVQVKALQSKDPEKPEKWETRRPRTTWLAYNRRADVILEPEGQQSTETYPNDVADARILWQRPRPSLKAVNLASKTPAGTEQARAGNSGS
jgi:hypothetical protein